MYGLLLESLACYIKDNYGEEKWDEIRRASGVEHVSFSTHQVYPENLIPLLAGKAIEVRINSVPCRPITCPRMSSIPLLCIN